MKALKVKVIKKNCVLDSISRTQYHLIYYEVTTKNPQSLLFLVYVTGKLSGTNSLF